MGLDIDGRLNKLGIGPITDAFVQEFLRCSGEERDEDAGYVII